MPYSIVKQRDNELLNEFDRPAGRLQKRVGDLSGQTAPSTSEHKAREAFAPTIFVDTRPDSRDFVFIGPGLSGLVTNEPAAIRITEEESDDPRNPA